MLIEKGGRRDEPSRMAPFYARSGEDYAESEISGGAFCFGFSSWLRFVDDTVKTFVAKAGMDRSVPCRMTEGRHGPMGRETGNEDMAQTSAPVTSRKDISGENT